jgi:peptidyl-prolyl cis-trans isomerase D
MFTEKLREGKVGPVAKIIFGLIIISFILAGVSSYLAVPVNLDPVKVNGHKLSNYKVEENVRLEKNKIERQLGSQAAQYLSDPNYLKQLRANVIEQMINSEVVLNQINNSGVLVGNNLVKEKIKSLPEFMVDGKFDQKQYENVLRRAGYTPNDFGEAYRNDISRELYLGTLVRNNFTLPHELAQNTKNLTQKRTIQKIDIDLATFSKDVKVTDDELSTYYQENKNKYLLPEKVKLSYIFLTASNLEGDVKYTDEDLQKYFNLHSELFTVPEKREVAHILVSTADDAEKKIKDIKAKLDAGEDFSKVAQEFSEDTTSKANGGKLPAFSLGNQDANFEKAAFALTEDGQISEPVETQYGWHIIKLLKVIPQEHQKFEDVKNTVIENYVAEQSKILFEDKLQIIENSSFENPDSLDIVVAKANENANGQEPSKAVKQESVDYVTLNESSLPAVLLDNTVKAHIRNFIATGVKDLDLADDASADAVEAEFLKNVTNSDVVRLGPEALFVYHIDGFKKSEPKQFNDVKEDLTTSLIKEKAVKASEEFVKQVVDTLNKGQSIKQFADEGKITINAEEERVLMSPAEDNQQIFEMPIPKAGNIYAKNLVDMNNNPYVIVLKKVEFPAIEKDDGRDNFLSTRIEEVNSLTENELLIQSSRNKAEIEYNTSPEYLKQLENQQSDY